MNNNLNLGDPSVLTFKDQENLESIIFVLLPYFFCIILPLLIMYKIYMYLNTEVIKQDQYRSRNSRKDRNEYNEYDQITIKIE
jgi:hypothetical protein